MSVQLQKIADIEAEMARTQKNKATNGHLGLLKAKLAKLKREVMDSASGGGGGPQEGFEVQKQGDARVGLVGFPSVGKSTLLSKMTTTQSEVASYEFTTLTAVPGTINYKGARIQMVDLPGIIGAHPPQSPLAGHRSSAGFCFCFCCCCCCCCWAVLHAAGVWVVLAVRVA